MPTRTVDEAWQELRVHLRWVDDPWIAFVWAPGSTFSGQLLERARGGLAGGRRLRVLRPATPEALRDTMGELLQPADEETCVWLEAVLFATPATGEVDPWETAWLWVLQRLNERREHLLRTLRGGLVLAMPLALKAKVAATAPDLWSVRSLALEVDGEGRSVNTALDVVIKEPPPEASFDLELARSDVLSIERRLGALEQRQPAPTLPERLMLRAGLAKAKRQLSLALSQSARHDGAVHAGEEAVEILRDLVDASSPERLLLADLGEQRAAVVDLREQLLRPLLARSLSNLGNRLAAVGRQEEALAAAQEAVSIRRELAEARPEVFRPGTKAGKKKAGTKAGKKKAGKKKAGKKKAGKKKAGKKKAGKSAARIARRHRGL